jgi:hypothetical protein
MASGRPDRLLRPARRVGFGFALNEPGDLFDPLRHIRADLQPVAGPAGRLPGVFEGFGQGTGKGVNLPGVLQVVEGPPLVLRALPHQLEGGARQGYGQQLFPGLNLFHADLHHPQCADNFFLELFPSSVAKVAQRRLKAVQGLAQDPVTRPLWHRGVARRSVI